MTLRYSVVISIFLMTISFTPHAVAYVGPGAGAGALGSLIGGVLWLGMLIMGSIWFPIRNAIGRIKKKLEKS